MKINISGLKPKHKGMILKLLVRAVGLHEFNNFGCNIEEAGQEALYTQIEKKGFAGRMDTVLSNIKLEAQARNIDTNSKEFKKYAMDHPDMKNLFGEFMGASSEEDLEQATTALTLSKTAKAKQITITTEQAQAYLESHNMEVDYYKGPGCPVSVPIKISFNREIIDLFIIEKQLTDLEVHALHAELRKKFTSTPERLIQDNLTEEVLEYTTPTEINTTAPDSTHTEDDDTPPSYNACSTAQDPDEPDILGDA